MESKLGMLLENTLSQTEKYFRGMTRLIFHSKVNEWKIEVSSFSRRGKWLWCSNLVGSWKTHSRSCPIFFAGWLDWFFTQGMENLILRMEKQFFDVISTREILMRSKLDMLTKNTLPQLLNFFQRMTRLIFHSVNGKSDFESGKPVFLGYLDQRNTYKVPTWYAHGKPTHAAPNFLSG